MGKTAREGGREALCGVHCLLTLVYYILSCWDAEQTALAQYIV